MPIVGPLISRWRWQSCFIHAGGRHVHGRLGLWTAVLRPLAGESAWEAVERAGNYGAPLALFLLAKGGTRSWTAFNHPVALEEKLRRSIGRILQWSTVLLLLGHALLGLWVRKPFLWANTRCSALLALGFEPLIGAFDASLRWPF